jgi:hypothetical protein
MPKMRLCSELLGYRQEARVKCHITCPPIKMRRLWHMYGLQPDGTWIFIGLSLIAAFESAAVDSAFDEFGDLHKQYRAELVGGKNVKQ